jgi:predicted DNA binding protein
MTTITEFLVPAEEFALSETLPKVPKMEIEVERVAAHERDRVLPFFWAAGDDFDRFEAALEADSTVENVRCLSELEEGNFYQMDWIDRIDLLIDSITGKGATLLSAHGQNDIWKIRMLFPDHDSVSEVYDDFRERGFSVEITQVYELEGAKQYGQYGLTDRQYETLRLAVRNGYFRVPRGTTLGELADELEISHQALSERLRRAQASLIVNALTIDADADEKVTAHNN